MATIIEVTDLPASMQTADSVDLLVAGANAKASRVAPCLTWDGTVIDQPAPTTDQLAEAQLVLVGAVKRWTEAGAGAYQSQNAGPFGITVDTRQRTGYNLWPSEIEALQEICKTGTSRARAFEVDTMPADSFTSGYPREGIAQVSQVTGLTYYSSDLGYLDADPA